MAACLAQVGATSTGGNFAAKRTQTARVDAPAALRLAQVPDASGGRPAATSTSQARIIVADLLADSFRWHLPEAREPPAHGTTHLGSDNTAGFTTRGTRVVPVNTSPTRRWQDASTTLAQMATILAQSDATNPHDMALLVLNYARSIRLAPALETLQRRHFTGLLPPTSQRSKFSRP